MKYQEAENPGKIRRRSRIGYRLYTSTMIAFVVSIMLLLLIMVFFVQTYISSQAQENADLLANRFSMEMDSVFAEAEKLCSIVGRNYDIQEIIRTRNDGSLVNNARERTEVNGKIGMLSQSYSSNVTNIGLYLEDGRRFKYGIYSLGNDYFQDEPLYQELLANDEFQWKGLYAESQALHSLEWACFVGGMNVQNLRNGKVAGVILTEISFNDIIDKLESWASDEVHIGMFDAATGEKIYCTRMPEWHDSASASSEFQILGSYNLRVYVKERMPLDGFMKTIIVFCAGIVFSFLLLTYYLSRKLNRSIAEPIEQLQEYLKNFEDEVGDHRHGDDKLEVNTEIVEIQSLSKGMEKLFRRIRQLLHAREEEQKVIRRAQVAALQAQINPHFLYNTMDSISWLIRVNEKEKALKTLYSFSMLFRLSLNNGKNFVQIREELEEVRHYVEILNVRYNNQIQYEIEVHDPEVLECYIPKLVLQPLVENSIEHGIGMRESQQGIIRVSVGYCPAGVCIEVHDDGVGMEMKTLDEINRLLNRAEMPDQGEKKSYGIYNVNNRLRVAYGQKYGISYESICGEYTRVWMRVPICNEKGEKIDDSNHHC